MKEIYEWVPWFMELSQRIANGVERYLVEKAKTVAWKDDGTESALLKVRRRQHRSAVVFLHSGEPKQERGEPKQDLSEHRQRIRAVAAARPGFG